MKKQFILAFAIVLLLTSCKESTKTNVNDQTEAKTEEVKDQLKATMAAIDYSGDYVTDTYSKRSEGQDWLVVSAKKLTDSTMHFAIRARVDKKKATCSFDGDGVKVSDGVYKATSGDSAVLFTFKDNKVTIGGEGKEDDMVTLHWFCSGGASLSDYTFTKINEPLDETQLNIKRIENYRFCIK